MANHRPKSLSELNNVYDKAMRAERAIKEGSSLLSVPETNDTPQSENIFKQLETKAAQAEKNQVFDPDITNIANDFLKRYAQAEKPKAAAKEIKRPAPSIQSVYHSAVKPKQEEKQDVSLSMGDSPALNIETPAVPLHKPAPTMPTVERTTESTVTEPRIIYEAPQPIEEAPKADIVTTPQTVVTDTHRVESPIAEAAPAKPQVTQTKRNVDYTPPRNVPSRVRITSTERNELMEEYMRVMSDEDDDETYKKPKFSFFKKKKKYEEEFDTEPMADLYDDLGEEDDEPAEEITPVPFDNSGVKYTDEYSDAPTQENETPVSQEQMNIYDYIQADFDYSEDDEEYSDEDDDGILDMSFAGDVASEAETAETEAQESEEELPEETAEEIAEILPEESAEDIAEAQVEETAEELQTEEAEEVIYPQQEETEVSYDEAPTVGMVFEDIFSVTDESKRSHTGGNWEEVFGENFAPAEQTQESAEEATDDYPEYKDTDSQEEYAQPVEEESEAREEYETQEDSETAQVQKGKKGKFFLKLITVFVAVICILGAAATLLVSAILDVNSGNLISDRYRAFSVSRSFSEAGLSANTLVITENRYAHTDDVFVFLNETASTFEFGKVTANVPSLSGDYMYLTNTDSGTKVINRDSSMGVVIATYAGIGGILAVICQSYILIAGLLLLLAIAMIVCFILISRRKADYEDYTDYDESTDDSENDDTDSGDSDTDADDNSDDDSDYYEFDTDGIEQGLFNGI